MSTSAGTGARQPLMSLVEDVAARLKGLQRRVIFAESCTGGLVSGSLARVPGISEFLCGSAVVYRLDTKAKWLRVPEDWLENPGPVSEVVAAAMSEGVLDNTPEADFAVSVTGHLGPNAPSELDGVVCVGITFRTVPPALARDSGRAQFQSRLENETGSVQATQIVNRSFVVRCNVGRCSSAMEMLSFPFVVTERERRQWKAVQLVLTATRVALDGDL